MRNYLGLSAWLSVIMSVLMRQTGGSEREKWLCKQRMEPWRVTSRGMQEVIWISYQFSCVQLCHPMNCSTPGLPVHQQLLESTQTHVHRVGDAIQPAISSSVIPFSSCPQSFPVSGSFPMSQLFASGGQSIGVPASTSVLPVNTQDWSPLGWTGWVSLQSKGLSRVFSNTTVQKHQFSGAQLSL